MEQDAQDNLLTIKEAIEQEDALSFRYRRADGKVTSHNAVYPLEVYNDEQITYFKAYCHFTHEVRSFRLDRMNRPGNRGGCWV